MTLSTPTLADAAISSAPGTIAASVQPEVQSAESFATSFLAAGPTSLVSGAPAGTDQPKNTTAIGVPLEPAHDSTGPFSQLVNGNVPRLRITQVQSPVHLPQQVAELAPGNAEPSTLPSEAPAAPLSNDEVVADRNVLTLANSPAKTETEALQSSLQEAAPSKSEVIPLLEQQPAKPADSPKPIGFVASANGHRHASRPKSHISVPANAADSVAAEPQAPAELNAAVPLAIAATSSQPQMADPSSKQDEAKTLPAPQLIGLTQTKPSNTVLPSDQTKGQQSEQANVNPRIASAPEPTGLEQKAAPARTAGKDEQQPKLIGKNAKQPDADEAMPLFAPQAALVPTEAQAAAMPTPVPSSLPMPLVASPPTQTAAISPVQISGFNNAVVKQTAGAPTKASTAPSVSKRPISQLPQTFSEAVDEGQPPVSDVLVEIAKVPETQGKSAAPSQLLFSDAPPTQPAQAQQTVAVQPLTAGDLEGAAPVKSKASATKPLSDDGDLSTTAAVASQKDSDRVSKPKEDGDVLPTLHAGQNLNSQVVTGVTASRTGASFSTSLHAKVSDVAASGPATAVQAAAEAPGLRHQVEVGFHDSTLGWLSVRATSGSDGALHLAMAGRADSAGTVDRMMPSLQHFLQDHDVRAHSLTYAQQAEPTVNASAGSSANYANTQTASQGNDRSGMGERQQRSLAGSERDGAAGQDRSEQKQSYRERPLAVSDALSQGSGLLSIRI